jgi:mycothiol synthase
MTDPVPRRYAGPDDVELLQAFNAAAIATTGGCGYLHPGDIPHHLFSGNRWFHPAELCSVWEQDGEVVGWSLVGPRHRSFDAQVAPDRRGGELERAVLRHAERATVDAMSRHRASPARPAGGPREELTGEVDAGDHDRRRLLIELGWTIGPPVMVRNRRSLADLARSDGERSVGAGPPVGYTIRTVRGVDEAGRLAELHAAAFGSSWTEEQYRRVMTSPGYAPEREYVAVTHDGRLAAFTVTWNDPVNRLGLFEPVGTHPDHRRRGLGAALLRAAMGRMAVAGMAAATVVHETDNAAAAALYRSCGFEPWQVIHGISKPTAP